MATTMNNYLARVKLVQGADLEALEDAPKPTSLYTATISVVGSTTTA